MTKPITRHWKSLLDELELDWRLAFHALCNRVSEASVLTIVGWSSGAMAASYTTALSNELADAEFERLWGDKGQ